MPLKFQVLFLLFAAASSMEKSSHVESVDFGNKLYPKVVDLRPRHAEKITGMLLHAWTKDGKNNILKDPGILKLLTNENALSEVVNEAYRVLFAFFLNNATIVPLENENEELRKELFKMLGPLFKKYKYSEKEFDVLVDKIAMGTPRRNDVKDIMIEVLEFKFGKEDVHETRILLMKEDNVLKAECNETINRDVNLWSVKIPSHQKSAIYSKKAYHEIMQILKDVGDEGNYSPDEIIESLVECGNDVRKAIVVLRSKNINFAEDDTNPTTKMTEYAEGDAFIDWGKDSIYKCPRVMERTDPSFRCPCELCQEYGKRKKAPWASPVDYWKEYLQIEHEENRQEQIELEKFWKDLQIEQEENRQFEQEVLQTRTYPFAVVVSYLEDYDRLALALCSDVLMRQVMRILWRTRNLKGERRFFAREFVLALEKAVKAASELSKHDLQIATGSKSEIRVSEWPPAKMVYLSKEYQIAYLIKEDLLCVVLKGENKYKNVMLKMRNEAEFANRRVFRRYGNSAVFFFPEAGFNEVEIDMGMMLYIFVWKEEEREMHCHWWDMTYTEDVWQLQEWLTSPQCDCPEKWLKVGNTLCGSKYEFDNIKVVQNLKK